MNKTAFGKIKKLWHIIAVYPDKIRILSLVIIALLMALPFGMDKMDLFKPEQAARLLYPFTVLFSAVVQKSFNFFYVSCFSFFLLPPLFIFIVISLFQKKINEHVIFICTLIAVTLYLSTSVSGIVLFANTERWFLSLSPWVYFAFFTALIFHIFLIAYGIISIKTKNESYMEYKYLLLEEKKGRKKKSVFKRMTDKLKIHQAKIQKKITGNAKIESALKKSITEFKNSEKKTRIKTKITIVILFTILVILSTFIYTDLKNYKQLLTQNVNTTGKNQAEQVAAIYAFSDGLHAKISAFLEGIKKTNASSPLPHQRVDIITTDSKKHIFLEQADLNTEYPPFNVFSYTTSIGPVRNIPAEEKRITAGEAAFYIRHFQNEFTRSEPIEKPEKGTCIYVYPITLARKEGSRLIGFSVVTYLKEVLNRPYFQAKVFLFSLSAVFFYASVIITLFLADFIANPIVFLSGNIRKTANILSEIFSGSASIEAERLIFEENIRTHDEIKNLSIEIKNIVSLVRGMLPYVSFHTIQNAEKNISRRSTTRDLCFLFTDVRGFTTLCENKEPKEVIAILNHYLDIETKIIFDNGGDIDKYVGDEIMAFFSGPKKEINACKAAMEIRKAMHREQQAAIKSGAASISIGIGINSGTVVFGPVGSKTRKDFTSIGDTVNLAARLEGANKEYGSKSIISESVYKNLNKNFICRELDYIAVKGKTEAVRIFEILQPTGKITREMLQDLKRLFETGLEHYRKRKWKTAEEYFSKCVEKYNDAPAKVFLRRTARYKTYPPKDGWTGVFTMNVK